jgi:vesicular inhibitory amino acid transporter
MSEKKEYPSVVNWAFAVSTFLYLGISVAGFIMFGHEVKQEITLNLNPGFLSHAAIMMTVINPISKFALTLNPCNPLSQLS